MPGLPVYVTPATSTHVVLFHVCMHTALTELLKKAMPAHTPIEGVDSSLNKVLEEHYVGTFLLPLKAVTSSISTHPVFQSGIDVITASMDKAGGFLELHAPLVTIDSDDIPEEGLDDETAPEKKYNMMDGAHRLHALKARNNEEACFLFRVYREYMPARQRIISEGERRVELCTINVDAPVGGTITA